MIKVCIISPGKPHEYRMIPLASLVTKDSSDFAAQFLHYKNGSGFLLNYTPHKEPGVEFNNEASQLISEVVSACPYREYGPDVWGSAVLRKYVDKELVDISEKDVDNLLQNNLAYTSCILF